MLALAVLLALAWAALAWVVYQQHLQLDALAQQVALLLTPTQRPPEPQLPLLRRLREIETLLRAFVEKLDGMEKDVAAAVAGDEAEPKP